MNLRTLLFLTMLLTLPACSGEPESNTEVDEHPDDEDAKGDDGEESNAKGEPESNTEEEEDSDEDGEEKVTAPGADAADGAATDGTAGADALAEARKSYHPALLDPSKATEEAPATYAVKFETTKGDIIIDVTREWAPKGADRFYNLVKIGYYDDVAFFRVIGGFMAQLGIHGDPQVNKVWRAARIDDEPVKGSNSPGMVTFAMGGPNSRTTQIFLNLADNKRLDGMGFAPFGKVRDMTVLESIHNGYGEGAPRGRGPHQGKLQAEGNAYLKAEFPELDYIKKATIVE